MPSDAGSVKDIRAGVVARLREREGELVQVIFARVRDDGFGPAGAADAEYVAGLRAAIAAALEFVLTGIEHGEEWTGSIPVLALEQARRAARIGVSLDTVLRRYVLGSTLLEEFVMDEADRGDLPGEREALRGALRVQALALNRLLEAITNEYRDELARAGRSSEQRRAERIRGLLAGGGVIEQSELVKLDYELDAWHFGVIARGAGAREVLHGLAASLDQRLLCVASGEETVWAWLSGQRRLEMAALERAVSRSGGVSFAVGEPARGLQGWRLTHQQAQAALVVALRRPQRFTRYADVALLATALKDEALARVLLDVYLLPLDDSGDRAPVLRETLHVYLAKECSVSSVAAMLNVARSTIEKRLRMIEKKLGRSLHPCPAELGVALQLYDLGVSADHLSIGAQ
jgi:DNA-binding PucR family transcriptional regulator